MSSTDGQLTDKFLVSSFSWHGGMSFAPIFGRFQPAHDLNWHVWDRPRIRWPWEGGSACEGEVGALVAVASWPAGATPKVVPNKKTLTEFLALRTPEEACLFASRWGPLGLAGTSMPEWKLVAHDQDRFGARRLWIGGDDALEGEMDSAFVGDVARKILAAANPGVESSSLLENEVGLDQYSGEPLHLWLWHAERLRTWRTLLKNPAREAVREAAGLNLHAARRLAWLNSEQRLQVKGGGLCAWQYEMWKEPILTDPIARFQELENPRTDPANWVRYFVAKRIQICLGGHLGFAPARGPSSPEAIIPDTLLAWLYLEFARMNERLFSPRILRKVPCQVCGRLETEHPNARGRRKYCGDACRKLAKRHGLDEARRRAN